MSKCNTLNPFKIEKNTDRKTEHLKQKKEERKKTVI